MDATIRQIHDLQDAATSDSILLPELLRKAWVIASRSNLEDQWIEYEFRGYPSELTAPDYPPYRIVYVELVEGSDKWGWKPISPTSLINGLREQPALLCLPTSVIHFQDLSIKNMDLIFPIPGQARRKGDFGTSLPVNLARRFSSRHMPALLEQIRVRVLAWSVDVEKRIAKQTMAPTDHPSPATNHHYHIQQAQGIFGTNYGTINQTNTLSSQRFNTLATSLREYDVPEDEIENLREAIQSDPPLQSASTDLGPQVLGWIDRMVKYAAEGTWNVATNAVGSLLASLIMQHMTRP